MKKYLKDYLKIIAMSITGLIFSIASFYLIMNYYHNEELNRYIYIGENNVYYTNYKAKLERISDNLITFSNKNHKKSSYEKLHSDLVTCYNSLSSEGTLLDLKTNQFLGPKDVYSLGSSFQSNALNVCWAVHLSYIKNDTTDFKDIGPFIANNVSSINNEINNAVLEIQNNSSYFYTTNITSSTIRNYLDNDFSVIANSYNEFADVVLLLSEKLKDGGY